MTKYTQYYPCGNGERVVSIEINKDTYKPGHKELDYNMEQKFAEVCQAHEMKEKQAKAAVKIAEPQRSQPYPSGSAEYSYRQAPINKWITGLRKHTEMNMDDLELFQHQQRTLKHHDIHHRSLPTMDSIINSV